MEPANGCRICMTILSGSVQGSCGLVYGGLAGTKTCGALRLHLDILQLVNGTQNYVDSDGIDAYRGVSGSDLHAALRRRSTIASLQPGPNLRKGTSYEGENCGGLHLGPLPEAASRLTRINSIAASWQHHLLLRALCFLQDETGALEECRRLYLDGWQD